MNAGKLLNGTGMVLAVILFAAVNLIAAHGLSNWRLDWTQGHMYTLSAGTQEILRSIKEPIQLKWYFSHKLAAGNPSLQAYAQRVREILDEYVRLSGGLIAVTAIDPEPFSEAEDEAMRYGLTGLPLDVGGGSVYFGLVGSGSADQESIIPLFQEERQAFLEYDLSKLIQDLSTTQKPIVGLLSSIPFGNTPNANPAAASGSPYLYEALESTFDIRSLNPEAAHWPSDLPVVLVIRPEKLSAQELFSLDQYILQGGHAVILTDPYAESDAMGGMPAADKAQWELCNQLFAQWGIRVSPEHVVADLPLAKKIWFTPHGRPEVVDYPLWLEINDRYLDQSDVVTAKLSPVVFSTAGHINRLPDPKPAPQDYHFTPLIHSSPEAMLVNTQELANYTSNPYQLLQNYQPGQAQQVLAARISGIFHTAFPNGITGSSTPGPSAGEEPSPRPMLKTGTEKAQILVFADTDWIQDKFWIRTQSFLGQVFATPVAANGNLLINAIDNLSGRNALISIRAQHAFSRPFLRIKAIQQAAQQAFRSKEQELQQELEATEEKLKALEEEKQEGNAIGKDADQHAELERFRKQKVQIRAKLRAIQHDLRQDILQLESRIRLINVYLFPAGVGLVGAAILYMRRKYLITQAQRFEGR